MPCATDDLVTGSTDKRGFKAVRPSPLSSELQSAGGDVLLWTGVRWS